MWRSWRVVFGKPCHPWRFHSRLSEMWHMKTLAKVLTAHVTLPEFRGLNFQRRRPKPESYGIWYLAFLNKKAGLATGKVSKVIQTAAFSVFPQKKSESWRMRMGWELRVDFFSPKTKTLKDSMQNLCETLLEKGSFCKGSPDPNKYSTNQGQSCCCLPGKMGRTSMKWYTV